MPEIILQNCTVYFTISGNNDAKLVINGQDVTLSSSGPIQKLTTAKLGSVGSDPSETIYDPTKNWLKTGEASKIFKFSTFFLLNLLKKNPELTKKDGKGWNLINKTALENYLKEHPEHRIHQNLSLPQSRNTEELIQKAISILLRDRKEIYPPTTVPKAIRHHYYTYRELSEKLGITESYFNTHVRPYLTDRLKIDIEYLKMQEAKNEEKNYIDATVEKAVEILDKEGKTLRSFKGKSPNRNDYMSPRELAERLDIPYYVFIEKIKPKLEGSIENQKYDDIGRKIKNWKETAKILV